MITILFSSPSPLFIPFQTTVSFSNGKIIYFSRFWQSEGTYRAGGSKDFFPISSLLLSFLKIDSSDSCPRFPFLSCRLPPAPSSPSPSYTPASCFERPISNSLDSLAWHTKRIFSFLSSLLSLFPISFLSLPCSETESKSPSSAQTQFQILKKAQCQCRAPLLFSLLPSWRAGFVILRLYSSLLRTSTNVYCTVVRITIFHIASLPIVALLFFRIPSEVILLFLLFCFGSFLLFALS